MKVKGTPTSETLAQLAAGVRLEESLTAPAQVRVLKGPARTLRPSSPHAPQPASGVDKTWLEITIGEGRKREIRRMCEYVGHPVEKLCRIALGPLNLGKLPSGDSRPLTDKELFQLRRAVGLA